MKILYWATGLVATTALVAFAGCSDDTTVETTTTSTSGTGGGGGMGGAGGSGESITIVIAEYGTGAETPPPLEGATVAFDTPSGERLEDQTDAEGKVTFDGIVWADGEAAVTAYLAGYDLLSIVHLDDTPPADWLNEDGEVMIQLASLTEPTPPPMTTVTGTATGLVDGQANRIFLFPFQAEGTYYGGQALASYEFTVEQNAPFTLVGIEGTDGSLPSNQGYFVTVARAMILDHDGFSDATATLDLDFATNEVSVQRADGTMTLPTREDSPLRTGWPNVWVFDAHNSAGTNTGWAELIDISTDGNAFDVSYIWVEPAALEAPFTYYQVQDTTSKEYSIAREPGYPQAGELDPPMLDVPEWTTVSDVVHRLPFHSPLAWEWFDADIPVANLAIVNGATIVWYVVAGPDATTVTIPDAPTGVDEAQLVGASPEAVVYGGTGDELYGFTRFAQSRAGYLEL